MSKVEDDYLEWYLEEKFCSHMERAGWETIKGDKIKRGYPDRFCFGPGGRTVIVEFKRTGAPSRRGEALQGYYQTKFAGLGFEVHLIKGQEDAEKLKNKLLS